METMSPPLNFIDFYWMNKKIMLNNILKNFKWA